MLLQRMTCRPKKNDIMSNERLKQQELTKVLTSVSQNRQEGQQQRPVKQKIVIIVYVKKIKINRKNKAELN